MLFTIATLIDPIKIVLIILGLLMLLTPALILGVIAFIIRSKYKKQTPKRQQQAKTFQPGPGSDADYERWKQERQNQGEN